MLTRILRSGAGVCDETVLLEAVNNDDAGLGARTNWETERTHCIVSATELEPSVNANEIASQQLEL